MRYLLCALTAAAMLFAACGSNDDDGSATPSGPQPDLPAAAATAAPPADDAPSDGNAPGIPPLTGEIVETASGLRYIDQAAGTGASPPSASECVTVDYTGWLTDGTQFDSSIDRGTPAVFPLDGVISGWTEGVGSMAVGGKRRLIIPGDLAYGAAGRPNSGIAPNATLIFDVELLGLRGAAVGGSCPS